MSWGCVLAGGRSQRMGRDKVTLPWNEQPLIARAVNRVREAGLKPVIAGARPDLEVYAPVVADRFPGAGPLAGMEAMLASVAAQGGDELVVFVAVDLPLLPAGFLAWLAQRAQRTGALVTVPFAMGAPQPLCSVLHTSLADGIAAALASGDRKVMRVLRALAAPAGRDFFRVEALLAADRSLAACSEYAPHLWWTNLNTPSDWERLPSTTLEER